MRRPQASRGLALSGKNHSQPQPQLFAASGNHRTAHRQRENGSEPGISPTFTFTVTQPIRRSARHCSQRLRLRRHLECPVFTPSAHPPASGMVQVTASALGRNQPPTLVFVHPPIDNIQVSVVPPVNSPPPACPNQQALPAACDAHRIQRKAPAQFICLSQNQIETLQASAFSQGVDITASVGPFTWSQASPGRSDHHSNRELHLQRRHQSGDRVTRHSGADPSDRLSLRSLQPALLLRDLPGAVHRSRARRKRPIYGPRVSSPAKERRKQSLPRRSSPGLHRAQAAADLDFVPAGGAGRQAAQRPDAPPAPLAHHHSQPGAAAITASCTPPTCNIGFPLNPSNLAAPYIPQPVYPVTAISGLVTRRPHSPPACSRRVRTVTATSLCAVALYNIATTTNLPGQRHRLPTPPNSLMFDPAGDKAYMGSEFGAFAHHSRQHRKLLPTHSLLFPLRALLSDSLPARSWPSRTTATRPSSPIQSPLPIRYTSSTPALIIHHHHPARTSTAQPPPHFRPMA